MEGIGAAWGAVRLHVSHEAGVHEIKTFCRDVPHGNARVIG
jgi:hypothetical protein